jgi:hypothetical protein
MVWEQRNYEVLIKQMPKIIDGGNVSPFDQTPARAAIGRAGKLGVGWISNVIPATFPEPPWHRIHSVRAIWNNGVLKAVIGYEDWDSLHRDWKGREQAD